jgi:hypothetical protein
MFYLTKAAVPHMKSGSAIVNQFHNRIRTSKSVTLVK